MDQLKIIIQTLLNESDTVKDLNTQIDSIAKKINKLNLKLEFDSSGLNQIKHAVASVSEQIQKEQLKIKKVTKESNLSGEGYKDLQARVEELRNSTDEYAKATIKTYKNTKNLKSAVIEYRDEIGRLVKEEMKWTEHVDKQNGVKKKVFQTTGYTFVDDIDKRTKAEEKARKEMEAAFRATEQRKRDEIAKTAAAQAKAIYDNTERERKRGENLGTFDVLKGKNVTEEQLKEVIRLNEAYKDKEIREISLDRVTGKYNVTLKENAKMNRIIKGEIDSTTGALYRQGEAVKSASSKQLGMFEQLKVAMQRIPIWMVGMGSFYGVLHTIQTGVADIVEIDKQLTNLQKVTDETAESYKNFAIEANELGIALGRTTVEVLSSTTDFARLGYSMREAAVLAQEALMLSNVGDINIEDSTKYLISTIKGFGIEVDAEAKNVRKALDIMNEVSNNFAISQQGIGEALRRSAASLSAAGNTLEQSVSLITAANTTLQDPSSVGTALKTVSMRLRGITEEGEEIVGLMPSLEKSFQNIGLTLKKDDETFKSTYEIFDDLSEIWSTLSDFQQANITELVAGKRQGNIVASMLANWKDAKDSLDTALNSTGSAAKEFEKYQDSIEYKLNRFKNTMTGFWQTNIDSQGIKNLIDSGTSLVQTLTLITEKFGLLPPVVFLVSAAFFALNRNALMAFNAQIALIPTRLGLLNLALTQTGNFARIATVAFAGLKAVMATFLPVIILTAATYAIGALINKWSEYRQQQKEIQKENEEAVAAYAKHSTQIDSLAKRYDELSKKQKTGLSTEEARELIEVQNELNQLMPQLTKEIDESGNAHLYNSELINEQIRLTNELKNKQDQITAENFNKSLEEGIKKLKDIQAEQEKLVKPKPVIVDDGMGGTTTIEESPTQQLQREKALIETKIQENKIIEENIALFNDLIRIKLEQKGVTDSLTSEQQEWIASTIKSNQASLESVQGANELADHIMTVVDSFKDATASSKDWSDVGTKAVQDMIGKTIDANGIQKELTKTYRSTYDGVKDLNDLLADLAEGKQINADRVMQLVEKEEELIKAITIENGVVKINKQAVEELINSKTKGFYTMLEQKKAEVEVSEKALLAKLRHYGAEIQAIETVEKARQAAMIASAKMADALTGGYSDAGVRNASQASQLESLIGDIGAIVEAKGVINKLEGLAKVGFNARSVDSKKDKSNSHRDKAFQDLPNFDKQILDTLAKVTEVNNAIADLENQISIADKKGDTAKKIELEKQLVAKLEERRETLSGINDDLRKIRDDKLSPEFDKMFGKAFDGKKLSQLTEVEMDNFITSLDKKINDLENQSGRATSDAVKNNLKDQIDKLQADKALFNYFIKTFQDVSKEIPNVSQQWMDDLLKGFDLQKVAEKFNQDLGLYLINKEIDKLQELKSELREVAEAKIQAIQNEIDALEKRNDLLNEEEERQQKLLDIAKQRDRLENLKKEKNIRLLQNGEFVWVANPKLIEDEQNKLQDMQEDYFKWEEDLRKKKEIHTLKDQITAIQEQLKVDEKKYDTQITNLRNFITAYNDRNSEFYSQTNTEFATFIEDLKTADGNGYSARLKLMEDFVTKYNKLVEKITTPDKVVEESPSGNSGSSGSSSSSVSIDKWGHNYEVSNGGNLITKNGKYVPAEDFKYLPKEVVDAAKELKKYHDGGIVSGKGNSRLSLIMDKLFNLSPNEEVVKMLKGELAIPEQNIAKNFIPNMRNLVNGLQPAVVGSSGQNIYIDKLEFPNATNADEIKKAIQSLPTTALQHNKYKGRG